MVWEKNTFVNSKNVSEKNKYAVFIYCQVYFVNLAILCGAHYCASAHLRQTCEAILKTRLLINSINLIITWNLQGWKINKLFIENFHGVAVKFDRVEHKGIVLCRYHYYKIVVLFHFDRSHRNEIFIANQRPQMVARCIIFSAVLSQSPALHNATMISNENENLIAFKQVAVLVESWVYYNLLFTFRSRINSKSRRFNNVQIVDVNERHLIKRSLNLPHNEVTTALQRNEPSPRTFKQLAPANC